VNCGIVAQSYYRVTQSVLESILQTFAITLRTNIFAELPAMSE